jgi:molecular chaperone DnaK
MVREAEQFAEEDKKRRESAEAKNSAEGLAHSTERQLAEHGDKVDEALKTEIQAAIDETRKAVESGDVEAMKSKTAALSQVAMKLGQAIYEKEQAGSAGGASDAAGSAETAQSGGREEEVVDAEFSEVDDETKG